MTKEIEQQNAAAAASEPDDDILLGSIVQPSSFTLSLGAIVRAAKEISGVKTAAEWNKFPQTVREEFIQHIVDKLPKN